MKKVLYIFVFLIVLLICSCSGNAILDNRGDLTICFDNQEKEKTMKRTIVPSNDAVKVFRYCVEGKNSGNLSFGPLEVNADSVTIKSLATGEWTITAYAENNSGKKLIEGSTKVTVNKGENKALINLDSFYGTGQLELAISWDPDGFSSPKIFSYLENEQGDRKKLLVQSQDNCNGRCRISDEIEAGSYILSVEIKQGGIVKGAYEAVRIIDGMISNGRLQIENNSQSFEVQLTDKSTRPIIGSLQSRILNDKFARLTFKPRQMPDNLVGSQLYYQWYKDGNNIGRGYSPDIDVPYEQGVSSRFDVIVKSDFIGSIGSATCFL